MEKFKIGDKVVCTLKSIPLYLPTDRKTIEYLNRGKIGIVTRSNPLYYFVIIDNFICLHEKDLELYSSYPYENKKSFYNDDVVVYYNDKGVKGVAINKDKDFDLEKGLAFAMLKTFGVTYTQFEEELKKLEKQEMKPKFKKIEVTTIGDDEKQFIKVEKQKDPIKKMIKKFEKGEKNGKRNTKKDDK